jgi:hypothetical protein
VTTFYWICFLMGLGLSIVSFVSGLQRISLFDHVFHTHSHAGGHGHHGHGRVGVHHAHAAEARVSMFNMAALTAFATWFGAAGLTLSQLTTWSTPLVVSSSLAGGAVGGAVINRFIRMLARDSKQLPPTTLAGTLARVTSPIREGGGTGEIVYAVNGTRQTAGARSNDDAAIAKGEEVVITRYEKGIAYVSTFDELTAITR